MRRSTVRLGGPAVCAALAWLMFQSPAAAQQGGAGGNPQPPVAANQAGGANGDCQSVRPARSGFARFWHGAPDSRRCLLERIRSHRRSSLVNQDDRPQWEEPLRYSEYLGDYYLARSDRFQAYLDGGTLATGVGALGAGLSSGAGPATVEAWGYGALAGILLVNLTGSEPMRDLYFAGHLGVGYIEGRYVVLINRLRALQSQNLPGSAACGGRGDEPLLAVESWGDGADKAAFLPIAQRISATCRDLSRGRIQLANLREDAVEARATLDALFAEDLLALDARLTEADTKLRASPSSALTSGAVGALRVLDALISGENTQEAVNRVKINALLDDFDLRLSPIAIAVPPQPVEAAIELSSDFETRSSISGRRTPQGQNLPTDQKVRDAAIGIRELQTVIETDRTSYNRAAYHARLLYDAARRSELRFDYEVATGTATVGLFDPASPDAGAAAAPSGGGEEAAAKEDGPQVMPPV